MEAEGTYPNQIHFYIKDRGTTAKATARDLGVSERMLNHYQHGRVAMPLAYRQRLADILETSVEELFPKNVAPTHRFPAPSPLALVQPAPLSANIPESSLPDLSEEILLRERPAVHAFPLAEVVSGDCAIWLSEKLAQILAFVTQRERRIGVTDMETVLDRELQVFNEVHLMFDPETYFLSRRNALLVIAALPHGLLGFVQQQKTSFLEEEFLPACAASVTACWHLLNGREFASVEHALSRYMPFLVVWTRQASSYQRTAAYLAAQGYLLLGLIALHRLHFQQRIICCKEAVKCAREAKDDALLVKALTQLGDAYYDEQLYTKMLQVYQQAKYVLEETENVPGSLQNILQSEVLMGLAHSYAQKGQVTDALNAMSEARMMSPGDLEHVPIFLSADGGLCKLILFEGWVRLDLGKYEPKHEYYTDATKALARIEELPQTLAVPERLRLEITNRRAQAAIGLGDLDAFCHYTLQSVEGLKTITSEKRRQEMVANYKQARKRWPQEPEVVQLADVIL